MNQALLTLRSRLDRFGVILSGLCMIHCLAGLFLVGVLCLGGGVLLNPEIHHIGLVLAIVISAATIGALRHGQRLPLMLGLAGLALMTAAVMVGHGAAESVLTIAGVLLVASAHVVNMRRNAC